MRIVVRSEGLKLFLPIPLRLAKHLVWFIPESIFKNLRKSHSLDQHEWISKKTLHMLLQEFIVEAKRYHGLEILHVETQDGTFISVRL